MINRILAAFGLSLVLWSGDVSGQLVAAETVRLRAGDEEMAAAFLKVPLTRALKMIGEPVGYKFKADAEVQKLLDATTIEIDLRHSTREKVIAALLASAKLTYEVLDDLTIAIVMIH